MNIKQAERPIISRQSTRPDLLIFEVLGKIDKASIEWMSETVNAAFDAERQIDLLLIFEAFEGSEMRAMFDPEAAAVMVRSLAHVRRYAVVGAPAWAAAMINLFKWVTPVEERTFGADRLGDAVAWIER